MIPVANYLPLRRKQRRIFGRQLLIGGLIGACGVAGFVAAAYLLARK